MQTNVSISNYFGLWTSGFRPRRLKRLGAYDASGTRVLKGKSNGQAAYVNGEWTGGSGSMGNYTVYVNPYIVLKSGGYSKHYYIEEQRIVSKLGDGLGDPTNGSKAGNGTVSYGAKQEEAREAIVKNLKFLGQDGSILTAGNSGKTPPGQTSTKGSTGGKEGEQFQYFYHPDHLGSSSFITDASGEVYQHLEYFAFGETFVEEHSNTDRTPYLFNGKELDEETGLYYYGARYYEPAISIWLSVDPLADEISGWSPYISSFNNPVKYVDPNGEYPIYFVTRSYAPFKKFGLPIDQFYGDNRGHSIDRGASYRTLVSIRHDTETKVTTAVGGLSRSHNVSGSKDATSRTKVDNRKPYGNKIDVHSYGNNAAQPGSWDIDQFTKLDVNIEGDISSDHILNIKGSISGDDFPNQEAFVYDSEGKG